MESLRQLKTEVIKFSGRGEVYSFSVMYHPPKDFAFNAPYAIAHIRLEEGPLVTAQLTDVELDKIYIGMPVEMVTRLYRDGGETGLRTYGYKFRPRM